jgi:hypothetical protein
MVTKLNRYIIFTVSFFICIFTLPNGGFSLESIIAAGVNYGTISASGDTSSDIDGIRTGIDLSYSISLIEVFQVYASAGYAQISKENETDNGDNTYTAQNFEIGLGFLFLNMGIGRTKIQGNDSLPRQNEHTSLSFVIPFNSDFPVFYIEPYIKTVRSLDEAYETRFEEIGANLKIGFR